MTLLRQPAFSPSKRWDWPRHLITPSEFVQALCKRDKINLIRTPIRSKVILQIIGSWSYLLARVLNKTKVCNIETFNQELRRVESQVNANCYQTQRENKTPTLVKEAPLLTLSNHISCIDDPILWASLLPLTYYWTNTNSVRWSAAAIEICFSKPWHSAFFSLGKTFPVIRGEGLEQSAMNFALSLLRYNQWLHMFPEGRVMRDANQQVISNKERGYIFKWGVSKLILDYLKSKTFGDEPARSIRILPFYHLGMDEVLPIGRPYVPRYGKQISIFIRPSVIEMNLNLLNDILSRKSIRYSSNRSHSDDELKRIKLTNYLEEEIEKLIEPTVRLHSSC